MKRKALAVLLGVFLLGVGAGVVLDRVALHRYGFFGSHGFRGQPQPPVGRILHQLTRELNLSDAQQQDVRTILKSTRTELKTTRQQIRRQVDNILKASETRIQNVLEPQQREAFEKLSVKFRARRKHRRHFRKWHRHHEEPIKKDGTP